MNRMNALTPDKPFFVHYTPGGTHAPHHPTPEWIKKISDLHLFDQGWNTLRDQIFANQMRLGVIPPNAKLTPSARRRGGCRRMCGRSWPARSGGLECGGDGGSRGQGVWRTPSSFSGAPQPIRSSLADGSRHQGIQAIP